MGPLQPRAMAASAVLPKHEHSDRDLAFAVMGVNFISTVVMVIYPALHDILGFSLFEMGVFLGGAIHDVAQVAGAGQTMGPQVLADAIITKLLRVAFLLPAVAGIAWWVARGGQSAGEARPGRRGAGRSRARGSRPGRWSPAYGPCRTRSVRRTLPTHPSPPRRASPGHPPPPRHARGIRGAD